MINKILPFLRASVPAAVAVKGLSKISPRIRNFFTSGAVAGYAADQLIDYLRDLHESESDRGRKQDLSSRARSGKARPDEMAAFQDIQESEKPLKLLKTGIAGAAGIAGALAGGDGAEEVAGDVAGDVAGSVAGGAQVAGDVAGATNKPLRKFFERAMEGISFFDIPDEKKAGVLKLKKRLDNLEEQEIPFEDKSVQKIVKGVKRLLSGFGKVLQEEDQRFQGQYQQQQQQQSEADAQFMNILDEFSKKFKF